MRGNVLETPNGTLATPPADTGMPTRASIVNAAPGGTDRALMAGTIATDDALGSLMEKMDSLNVLNTTLIIVLMDHGMIAKDSLYEGGTRIAMMARLPGVFAAGSTVSRSVTNLDVVPTLFEFAQVTADYALDGMSWLGDARGTPSGAYRANLFYEIDLDRAVLNIASNLKLISRSGTGNTTNYPASTAAIQLYNLTADPTEQVNLATSSSYSSALASLQSMLACQELRTQRTNPVTNLDCDSQAPTQAALSSAPTPAPATFSPTAIPTPASVSLTSAPTAAPASAPVTSAPTSAPATASPTATPTPASVPVTSAPTSAPATVSPTATPTPASAPVTSAPTSAPVTESPTTTPTPASAPVTSAPTNSPSAIPTIFGAMGPGTTTTQPTPIVAVTTSPAVTTTPAPTTQTAAAAASEKAGFSAPAVTGLAIGAVVVAVVVGGIVYARSQRRAPDMDDTRGHVILSAASDNASKSPVFHQATKNLTPSPANYDNPVFERRATSTS
jgi:hypothetical protein